MFTSVMAILQTSAVINKNQFIDITRQVDNDKILIQKQNDKIFIQLLSESNLSSLGSGKEICNNLKNGFTDKSDPNYLLFTKYLVLNSYKKVDVNSLHSRFINGCAMNMNSHRVVIVPSSNIDMKYNIFSCIIDSDYQCGFENIN